MSLMGISTGCFIGNECRIRTSEIEAVEISRHNPLLLKWMLSTFEQQRVVTLSVHCPHNNACRGLNVSAEGDEWRVTEKEIYNSMELAARLNAKFVVIHAFYVSPGLLPTHDNERMKYLRLFNIDMYISDYVYSEIYQQACNRAEKNLKSLLPSLVRRFPKQKLLMENINPRIGYVFFRISDLRQLATSLGGDIGICLDLGHLHLSETILPENVESEFTNIRDLVHVVHIHQNFGGKYGFDRQLGDPDSQSGIQELDTHAPLKARYNVIDNTVPWETTAENRPFENTLKAAVVYTPDSKGTVVGSVPIQKYLSLLPLTAIRILEYDSRYTPLDVLLKDYSDARTGKHEVPLW